MGVSNYAIEGAIKQPPTRWVLGTKNWLDCEAEHPVARLKMAGAVPPTRHMLYENFYCALQRMTCNRIHETHYRVLPMFITL